MHEQDNQSAPAERHGAAYAAAHAALDGLDYGVHGLTRDEIRDKAASLPAAVYLHLPASKRFLSADEVIHEVQNSAGRAEGDFVAANDETGSSAGHPAPGSPAGYGNDPLVEVGIVGESTNQPVAGFDGNSIETEREFPR